MFQTQGHMSNDMAWAEIFFLTDIEQQWSSAVYSVATFYWLNQTYKYANLWHAANKNLLQINSITSFSEKYKVFDFFYG